MLLARSSKIAGMALAFTIAMLAAACGPSGPVKVTVKGNVTYKGKKMTSGIVTFNSDNGSYSAASIMEDGTYIMTDVLPGEIGVGVMESPQGSGSSSGDGPSKPSMPAANLPQKFRDPSTSGLKFTVKVDTKELDIKMD
jgi:hypothetical protein